MTNTNEAAADKARQQKLLSALGAARNSLRRDECGAWRIAGSRGHIYTWGPGWLLYVSCGSGQHWTWIKKRLTAIGCTVTQDGDDEGCLRLDDLPTATTAKREIREAIGLRRNRVVSDTQAQRLKSFRAPPNDHCLAIC